MDYKKLQNGSDIRGVALEGIEGQHINLTETACKDIGRGFALWLMKKTGKKSGLREVMKILRGVEDIAICTFDQKDVVRHQLVQRIIEAYDRYEEKKRK